MEGQRVIRHHGTPLGPYPLARLAHAITTGKLHPDLEFYSETKHQWLPVIGILEDLSPSEERLKLMKNAGVTTVAIQLGAGTNTCKACRALAKSTYPINAAPTLPPPGCQCIPWCRSCLIPAQ